MQHPYHLNLLPTHTITTIAMSAAVTAVVLATIAAATNALAALANVLTFAVTITAAATKVTAVIVIVAAAAVVAQAQHVVHVKPPNGQTQSSVAPKGKSTIGILIYSVSIFLPF
jgi:hypothetical protein